MVRLASPRVRIAACLLAGVLGMMAVVLGLAYLVLGRPLFLRGFPSGAADAVTGVLAGLAAMLLAVLRMRRGDGRQAAWRPDA
ncbi:MAG: hypothetical protein OHK0026_01140 [Rhodocyclaceae bacterium]